MKRLMVAALALSLLDAGAALAQDDHHDHGGGPPPGHAGPPPGGHPGGPPPGGGHPGGPVPGHWSPAQEHAAPGASYGAPQHNGPYPYVQGGTGDRPHFDGAPAPGPGAAGGWRGPQPHFGAPGFAPGGGDRPRYDAHSFPHVFHPTQRFHWRGAAWVPPSGYAYRRWHYGEFLPSGWFAAQFWIGDYDYYGLAVPPYGYEWVRFGPDALLVDTYTGEVVESVYGLFY